MVFLPLQKIIGGLKIEEHLVDLFNEKDRNMIVAMAHNRVIRPTAMYNLKTWYENSALSLRGRTYLLTVKTLAIYLLKWVTATFHLHL
jgi:hypothetical protein